MDAAQKAGVAVKTRVAALGLFLGTFALFVHQAAPAVTAGDSGEFMTGAATLSLPHSPSFPLYVLLGKCFLALMPFGSVFYRMNIFSALTSGLTVTVVFFVVRELQQGRLASACVALIVGLGTSFWENSLVTEVFALNTLFLALLLWCLVRNEDVLFAFLLGLGLTNHQVILFAAPALIAAMALRDKRLDPRKLAACAIAGAIGLTVYLTLPIRSAQNPPLNWGQPTTVQKFYRTLTRKDYGSMKLSIGDAPERTLKNAAANAARFVRHLKEEAPYPVLLLAIVGFFLGWKMNKPFFGAVAVIFILSGPFFSWLGNLPFNGQSDGVMGRFLIMPWFALAMGLVGLVRWRKNGLALLMTIVFFLFWKGAPEAQAQRDGRLVYDYGRAMLSTLPAGSALFMDGGDDAFYSLAALHYVGNRRPDVSLHDRGGLVFANPYGDDFRRLPKEEKNQRRWAIERASLAQKPLFYSSMDFGANPGLSFTQRGFLYEASLPGEESAAPRFNWPLVALRSLHPTVPGGYRTRALACFFPYMRGRAAVGDGDFEEMRRQFLQSLEIGFDVDWLKQNISFDLSRLGYDLLVKNRYADSEKVYRSWIEFDPKSSQAQCNLGVALERQNKWAEAEAQYKTAAALFPEQVDPVFNLGVLAWKQGNWPNVVKHFEEVLRRKPDHADARRYLDQAKGKLNQ